MSQPWESDNGFTSSSPGIRVKIKKAIKAAPMVFTMVGLTYACFLYTTLVKRRETE
tara:strand:- start:11784 stop:11951 length:168 start_codon:yes stop_codon:yes gene_type:complete